MLRTSQRPLVLGVNPKIALGLGIGFGITGMTGLMSYNMLTAAIGASVWFSYLFIYTRMKTSSELNTFRGNYLLNNSSFFIGFLFYILSACL